MSRRDRQRGFTLLEVMIAMALLVVALAALLGHEAVAVQMSHYSNRVAQAALLAQGKLLEVEHTLKKDGMESFDDCRQGDFRAEGFRDFEWKACGFKVELAEGATEQMAEQVMGMIAGMGIPGLEGVDLGALAQGQVPEDGEGGEAGARLAKMAGQFAMAMGAIPAFIQQLEDKVRKVRVEVTWKDALEERVLLIERFVTTLGSDPANEPPPPDGEAEPVPDL